MLIFNVFSPLSYLKLCPIDIRYFLHLNKTIQIWELGLLWLKLNLSFDWRRCGRFQLVLVRIVFWNFWLIIVTRIGFVCIGVNSCYVRIWNCFIIRFFSCVIRFFLLVIIWIWICIWIYICIYIFRISIRIISQTI